MKELKKRTPHPMKGLLAYYNIPQAEMAMNLNVSQPYFNRMLVGLTPMKPEFEKEMDELFHELGTGPKLKRKRVKE